MTKTLYDEPSHQQAVDETKLRIFKFASGDTDEAARQAYAIGAIEAAAAFLVEFSDAAAAGMFLADLSIAITKHRRAELTKEMN